MAEGSPMDDRWTETVRLQVGADKRQWIVHPHYLTRCSDFFRSALKRTWQSGLKGTVRVEHVDPWLLNLVLEWGYGAAPRLVRLQHGLPGLGKWNQVDMEYEKMAGYDQMHPENPAIDKLFRQQHDPALLPGEDRPGFGKRRTDAEIDRIYINLVRLYVLADELGAVGLMQYLYFCYEDEGDHSCDLGDRLPPPEALALAWQLLPDGDQLKEQWLEWTARCMTVPGLEYAREFLPTDFQLALLRKMFEIEVELA